jgi:hypothetical protein
MNKYANLAIAIVAGIAAALTVLPYDWGHVAAAGIVAGIGSFHATFFGGAIMSKPDSEQVNKM